MWCAVQIYHANTLCWVNIAKIQHVQLYPVFSPSPPSFIFTKLLHYWIKNIPKSCKAAKKKNIYFKLLQHLCFYFEG